METDSDRFVVEANVKRYRELLLDAQDPAWRATLQKLLCEAEKDLRAFDAARDMLRWQGCIAAAISFVVSAASNYFWNRHWTFRRDRSHVGVQGARFFVVSLAAFGVNQLWLLLFIDVLDWRKVMSQAIAIILVTPLNFLGNKLWSFT